MRTERAIQFDEQSRAALEQDDLGSAYRQEQFAYALAPRDERALTLGALAYLRDDYPAARQHFRTAEGSDTDTVRNRALVGAAAAAAQTGDHGEFERAVREIGTPEGAGLRLALANAAIDAGDLGRADELLRDDQPTNHTVAFAKAVAQAGDDFAAAQATLAAAERGTARPTFPDPAYERFIERLISVPRNGGRDLAITLDRFRPAANDVTRTVALASMLQSLGDLRAAERLAREAVQSTPDYRDGWNVLAAAQLDLREFADAERSLKISTDLDAGYGYTWYLRSQLAEATKKQSEADEYRKRAELLGYEQR